MCKKRDDMVPRSSGIKRRRRKDFSEKRPRESPVGKGGDARTAVGGEHTKSGVGRRAAAASKRRWRSPAAGRVPASRAPAATITAAVVMGFGPAEPDLVMD
jgi:hypothetical protein